MHNEELVEKTSVSESLQNQNIECFLIISKGNNLNLGLFNSQTKIFAKTSEIFGDFTVQNLKANLNGSERTHLSRIKVLCIKVNWYLWHQRAIASKVPFEASKMEIWLKLFSKWIRQYFCNLCQILYTSKQIFWTKKLRGCVTP